MSRSKLARKQPVPDWGVGQQTLFGAPRPEAPVPSLHPRELARAARRAAKAEKRVNAVDKSDLDTEEPDRKRGGNRKMRAEWYGTFSFLSEIQTPEGPAMVCTTCKRAGLKKGLGAKPSTNFRKSVLADHAKSKEHLQAIQLCKRLDMLAAEKEKERQLKGPCAPHTHEETGQPQY